MKSTTVLSGALIALSSFTDAADYSDIQAASQSTNAVVTGIQNNGIQTRVELRTMAIDMPDTYNLYMLGLQSWMQVDQEDPLSYYQIAGIHGRPYSPWEGWTSAAGPNGYGGGYCTHVSNIFLTWHRPYLAMFEQTLFTHVQAAADAFPSSEQGRWQAAAAKFRIPYWDWAAEPTCPDCELYPKLVSSFYYDAQTPTGNTTIQNPLFRYDFHPINATDMIYTPFATLNVTKRYPTNWSSDAVSQNDKVRNLMNQNRDSLADRLYNLFTNYNNFTEFSNEAWEASSGIKGADSIESVHDAIHSITGSNGHMTYLDYSAFDPIFFLHHANVDRLWAMWSGIYNNTYVTPLHSPGTTYTWPSGTLIDDEFGLVPWMKNGSRGLFTSLDVRDTTLFGYDYPETANGTSPSTIKTAVNALYGNSTTSSPSSKRGLDGYNKDGQYEYIVNIVSQKFQMNGSYGVYVFLGDPGAEPSDWPASDNLVGMHAVAANLANETHSGMSAMDLPITGTVPLTSTLRQKVSARALASMDPGTVEDYLQQNLEWRVAMFDGTYVPAADVPDFSVTVVTSQVQPATAADEFPTWGNFAAMANATSGKIGGHDDAWWGSEENWTLGSLIAAGLSS